MKQYTSTGNYNRNPALQTSFRMVFPYMEELNYSIQTVELPGLTMAGVETPWRNHQASAPSNRIDYDLLNFTFIVDEDFANFNGLRLWMHRITKTNDIMVKELQDCTLHVLDSNKNPKFKVVFFGSYPSMLTAIPLESSTTDAMPVICTATLRYQYYDFT